MAVVQALCASFKLQILQGVHDFDTDVFKLALYTPSANLGVDTTVYTTSGEVSSANYTAGGVVLTQTLSLSSNIAYVDFSSVSWGPLSATLGGGLIYNTSKSNKAVAVVGFGSDITLSYGDFFINFPANGPTTALIRIV